MAGKGFDVGTHMFVAAQMDGGDIEFTEQVDAFFTLEATEESKNLLEMLSVPYVERKGKISVIGEDARKFANMFKAETRRPLQQGCLNKKDMDALGMLQVIIGETLGKPSNDGEVLKYSVTSTPLGTEMNFEYHKAQLENIFRSLGYEPGPVQEARAIALSELASESFTGLCISCLPAGSLVYTRNGLEDISTLTNDSILLDKEGNYTQCLMPTSRDYEGNLYQIIHDGIGDDERINPYFTYNHEIWTRRDDKWQYISAENLREGDIIGEKIPAFKPDAKTFISIYHNETGVKSLADKRVIHNSQAVSRFIGYFLGDGHLQQDQRRIRIDFGKHETNNIEDLKNITEQIFESEFRSYEVDNRVRCDIVNPGLWKWLNKYCYNNKEKIMPWNIQELNQNQLIGLVQGLARSDGWFTENGISFENTSSSLSVAFRQALHMLGIPTAIGIRNARDGGLVEDGRHIKGQKLSFSVRSSQALKFNGLKEYLNNNDNVKFTNKLWIQDGFVCSRVRGLNVKEFKGKVYDIAMPSEHSFTVPGITVHNCGAGTTTVYLGHYGIDNPNLQFSIDKGGDWIDGMASDMFEGLTRTKVQTVKEKGFSILEPNKGINVDELEGQKLLEARAREALSAYYKSYIDNVFRLIKQKFESEQLPEFSGPITCVIAGGTSMAGDFIKLAEEALERYNFGLDIKEVRHAEEPKHAVAKGCLVAAQLEERKKAKAQSAKSSRKKKTEEE